ncbi:MAG TPA: hypothetical protein VHM26_02330 [Chitinophagaceae bacterium]|jgi:hypothetical protein|nr:hypothetical protein [Chitinophagaceae bacterium]
MTGIKLHHFLLESAVVIFIILGFATASKPDSLLMGLLYCDFIIILVQVIHSFILASLYGNNNLIHRWLRYYWKGVSICIFSFFAFVIVTDSIGHERDSAARMFFTWLIALLPIIPSIYLWIITWHFRSWGRQMPGTLN